MQLSVVLALVAAATVVSAETNARRLARGLSPNAPGKRATPVARGHGSTPSGSPGNCNTGKAQCCTGSGYGGSTEIDLLCGLVGIPTVSPDTLCGTNCSPMSGSDCEDQPMCCNDNSYNGLINIGCSPITIDL